MSKLSGTGGVGMETLDVRRGREGSLAVLCGLLGTRKSGLASLGPG